MRTLLKSLFIALLSAALCAGLCACGFSGSTDPVVSYSVSFSKTELTLTVGETVDLPAATVYQTTDGKTETTDLACAYSVSEEEILRLSSNGKLTALSRGTTTLVAKYKNASAVMIITVEEKRQNRVTIVFDSGYGAEPFQREVFGTVVILPETERKGYTFDGWDTGKGIYPAGATIDAPTENVTFTATWTKIDYTITYILNGGINSAQNPLSYTVDSETVVLQYPEKANAIFSGWYRDAEMATRITVIPKGSTGNLTLYAKFDDLPVASFSGGAGATGSVASVVTERGANIVLPQNGFTKIGYRFVGWSDGVNRYAAGDGYTLSASVVFTAEWEMIEYSVTYHLDGGSNAAENPISYNVADPDLPLSAAEKSGYRFGGWYSDPTFFYPVEEIRSSAAKDMELYAKFDRLYRISFLANGGKGTAPADLWQVKNGTVILPENPFTNAEAFFDGWSDGKKVYRPGDRYPVTGDTSFSAQWTENFEEGTLLFDLAYGGYTIVYQNEAAIKGAAESLRDYLFRVFGVKVPILSDEAYRDYEYKTSKVISLGTTQVFQSLEHFRLDGNTVSAEEVIFGALSAADSFAFVTDRYTVCLVGNNENGVLYAADQFAEDYLGIRFLAPEVIYVPKMDSARILSQSSLFAPQFAYRQYLNSATYYPSQTADIEYTRHLRFNGDYAPSASAGDSGFTWYTDAGKGIGTAHNTLAFVNPAKYAAYASTMFFTYGGSIIDVCYTDGITSSGEIDRSTPAIDTAAEAMYAALYDLLANTDKDDFWLSVGQADTNEYCPCDDCVAATKIYNRSGISIRFWNAILRELETCQNAAVRNKNYRLVMFAYQYNLIPPVVNGTIDPTCVPDKEHLWVRIAPIVMDRYLALSSARQPLLQRENGRVFDINASLGHLPSADIYENWAKVTSNLFSWTYTPDFDNYFAYTGALAHMKDNLSLMKECGVEYVFIQGVFNERIHADQYLDAYVTSKLIWNPDADVTDLRDEFLLRYYGEDAYEKVKRYYDAFDEEYAKRFSVSGTGSNGMGKVYGTIPDSFYLSQTELLEQAKAASSAEYAQRIDALRLVPLFMLAKQNESYRTQFTDSFAALGGRHVSEGRTVENFAW